jgi:hypothetical protein
MKPFTISYPVVLAILFTTAGRAQSPVRIQNHFIGERADALLKDEPGMTQRLTEFPAMKAHPDDYINVPAKSSPQLIEAALAVVLQQHGCPDLETVFVDKGSSSIFREVEDGAPTKTLWVFKGGVITEIELTYYASSYSEAKQDATAKLHASPVEGTVPYQNGFDATWKDRTADWLTPTLHAHLEQDNNPADSGLTLVIESRAAYRAQIKAQNNRPNSLD